MPDDLAMSVDLSSVHNKSMVADRLDIYPKNADKKTFFLEEKKWPAGACFSFWQGAGVFILKGWSEKWN